MTTDDTMTPVLPATPETERRGGWTDVAVLTAMEWLRSGEKSPLKTDKQNDHTNT